eukprot:COSAG06_NODE_5992_length_3164_cov_0.971289_2_plen_394_part_00
MNRSECTSIWISGWAEGDHVDRLAVRQAVIDELGGLAQDLKVSNIKLCGTYGFVNFDDMDTARAALQGSIKINHKVLKTAPDVKGRFQIFKPKEEFWMRWFDQQDLARFQGSLNVFHSRARYLDIPMPTETQFLVALQKLGRDDARFLLKHTADTLDHLLKALEVAVHKSDRTLAGMTSKSVPEQLCHRWRMYSNKFKRVECRSSNTIVTTKPPVLALPSGKKHHFFICHHQGSGSDQCRTLELQLKSRGYKVWFDNGVSGEERTLDGMREGVRGSMCVLIFLSGRKEVDGVADPNGNYEGPFTRWFCHAEMGTAREAGVPFVGVMETDKRHGEPDFAEEKRRGRHAHDKFAAENVKLLDNLCFIPFRRQEHEIDAMLVEIGRQMLDRWTSLG